MTYTILVAVQVVVALTLIGLILVQHGKGADAGAAFGSGASGTVFGAKGSANFLSHATAALAVIFFCLSLTLAYLINGNTTATGNSVTEQLKNASSQVEKVLDHDETSQSGSSAAASTAPGAAQKESGGKNTANNGEDNNSGKSDDTNDGVTAKVPE